MMSEIVSRVTIKQFNAPPPHTLMLPFVKVDTQGRQGPAGKFRPDPQLSSSVS